MRAAWRLPRPWVPGPSPPRTRTSSTNTCSSAACDKCRRDGLPRRSVPKERKKDVLSSRKTKSRTFRSLSLFHLRNFSDGRMDSFVVEGKFESGSSSSGHKSFSVPRLSASCTMIINGLLGLRGRGGTRRRGEKEGRWNKTIQPNNWINRFMQINYLFLCVEDDSVFLSLWDFDMSLGMEPDANIDLGLMLRTSFWENNTIKWYLYYLKLFLRVVYFCGSLIIIVCI